MGDEFAVIAALWRLQSIIHIFNVSLQVRDILAGVGAVICFVCQLIFNVGVGKKKDCMCAQRVTQLFDILI